MSYTKEQREMAHKKLDHHLDGGKFVDPTDGQEWTESASDILLHEFLNDEICRIKPRTVKLYWFRNLQGEPRCLGENSPCPYRDWAEMRDANGNKITTEVEVPEWATYNER